MPNLRIVTGSYEHNLLCVALTFGEKGDAFTPIFHFTPHTQSIRSLAWSRKVLASGANDELIRLYDLQHRKEIGTLMHHSGQILALQFIGKKWLLSAGGDNKICIWRTKDWELLAELSKGHKAAVLDMSVHKSGKIMLSIGIDRKLILWNLMTARKASVRKLKEAPVQVSFCNSDDASSYVVAFTKSVVLYGASGQAQMKWELMSSVHRIGWYHELLIVSTDDGKLHFLDLSKKEPEFVLQGHATRVKDFSVLDQYMASVSSDGNIVVWDLEKRDQIAVYNTGDRLNCVALVPDDVEGELKRPEPETQDTGDVSDFSEVDEPTPVAPPKKKKKKARVIITEE